jgi:hypothetical protein
MTRSIALGLVALAAVAVACDRPAVVEPPASVQSAPVAAGPLDYGRPEAWLCRPDIASDACHGDLDLTELRPDGTRVVVPFVPADKPTVDCFYVYPTVDLAMVPGNHTDFTDTARMRETAHAQVARFGAACRIFAPLYRQMTFGTYFAPADEHERRFAMAFADVDAAFHWYLSHSEANRWIVLVGHSQGAQIVERLLSTEFDGDAGRRTRLLVAMPIGGDVQVAEGSSTGGTFRDIPLCTSDGELGCVVAYNAFRPAGSRRPWPGPPPPGRRSACVNPADVAAGGKHPLSLAVFATRSRYRDGMPGAAWATTPFIGLPDFYSAWCAEGQDGFRFLAIDEASRPGDLRSSPIDLSTLVWRTKLGLHQLEMQLGQGDLIRLIQRKAAAAAERASSRATPGLAAGKI